MFLCNVQFVNGKLEVYITYWFILNLVVFLDGGACLSAYRYRIEVILYQAIP